MCQSSYKRAAGWTVADRCTRTQDIPPGSTNSAMETQTRLVAVPTLVILQIFCLLIGTQVSGNICGFSCSVAFRMFPGHSSLQRKPPFHGYKWVTDRLLLNVENSFICGDTGHYDFLYRFLFPAARVGGIF